MDDDIEVAIERSIKRTITEVRSTTIEEIHRESAVKYSWFALHAFDQTVSRLHYECYPESVVRAHEYFMQGPDTEIAEKLAKMIFNCPPDDRAEIVRCAMLGVLILERKKLQEEGDKDA